MPVWALGSFLLATLTVKALVQEMFQCPCGLWGLFYYECIGTAPQREMVSVPVWALGSFLLIECETGRSQWDWRVSVPVWALGSFLLSLDEVPVLISILEGFSARVGSGVFSTTMFCRCACRSSPQTSFQCPCGLWGLFYRPDV